MPSLASAAAVGPPGFRIPWGALSLVALRGVWLVLASVAMGDDPLLCGAEIVHPISQAVVGCRLAPAHRAPMHHHDRPPNLMHWPVSPQRGLVTCPAWRTVDTAMGRVVVFCARLASLHKVGEHESRIGIQPVRWTDADMSRVGEIAERMLKVIRAECRPGDLVPAKERFQSQWKTGSATIAQAMELLARDGVVRPRGRRWEVL